MAAGCVVHHDRNPQAAPMIGFEERWRLDAEVLTLKVPGEVHRIASGPVGRPYVDRVSWGVAHLVGG